MENWWEIWVLKRGTGPTFEGFASWVFAGWYNHSGNLAAPTFTLTQEHLQSTMIGKIAIGLAGQFGERVFLRNAANHADWVDAQPWNPIAVPDIFAGHT